MTTITPPLMPEFEHLYDGYLEATPLALITVSAVINRDQQWLAIVAEARAAAFEEAAQWAENYDLGTPDGHAIAAAIRLLAKGGR